MPVSAARPVPPIAECYEMGIVVCAGSDGIRDSWGPYGNGDMLERAMILGLRNNLRRDDEVEMALDVCTYGGAKVMHRANYGLEVGCDADLVLLFTSKEVAAQYRDLVTLDRPGTRCITPADIDKLV